MVWVAVLPATAALVIVTVGGTGGSVLITVAVGYAVQRRTEQIASSVPGQARRGVGTVGGVERGQNRWRAAVAAAAFGDFEHGSFAVHSAVRRRTKQVPSSVHDQATRGVGT